MKTKVKANPKLAPLQRKLEAVRKQIKAQTYIDAIGSKMEKLNSKEASLERKIEKLDSGSSTLSPAAKKNIKSTIAWMLRSKLKGLRICFEVHTYDNNGYVKKWMSIPLHEVPHLYVEYMKRK